MKASSRLAAVVILASIATGLAPALRAQVLPQEVLTAQQVQQLAPQLVAFAGSAENFQNLAAGLSLGAPITLTAVGPEGNIRSLSFSTAGGLGALEIARTLEAARQQLITLGIGAPTIEQLAVTLVGGELVTPVGVTPLAGLLQPVLGLQAGVSPAVTPPVVPGVAVAPAVVPVSPLTAGTLPGALGPRIVDVNPLTTRPSAPSLFTSSSPFFGTSDSVVLGTSNTPVRTNLTTLPAPGAAALPQATLLPSTPTLVPTLPGAAAVVPGTAAVVPATTAVVPGTATIPLGATTLAPNGLPSPAAQIQSRR